MQATLNVRKLFLGAIVLILATVWNATLAQVFAWQISNPAGEPEVGVIVCLDEVCAEEPSDIRGYFTIRNSGIVSEGWYTLRVYDNNENLLLLDDIYVTGRIEYDGDEYIIRPQPLD